MADAEAFDFVCGELERETTLDRLAARGTVRIALKQAGLEARSVTPAQMLVVVAKVLPRELASRGFEPDALCSQIADGLHSLASTPGGDTPDVVFKRLGGGD